MPSTDWSGNPGLHAINGPAVVLLPDFVELDHAFRSGGDKFIAVEIQELALVLVAVFNAESPHR